MGFTNIRKALDEVLPFDYILVTVRQKGAQVFEVERQKGEILFLARYTGVRFPIYRKRKDRLVVKLAQIQSIVSIT